MLAFDWRYTLAESDLPKVLRHNRLAGVEVGFPMLDERIARLLAAAARRIQAQGRSSCAGSSRKRCAASCPTKIITKKKQGFGLPFGVWATRHEGLRKLALASVNGLVDRGILRRDFVDDLLDKHLYEHPGYFGEMIWIP